MAIVRFLAFLCMLVALGACSGGESNVERGNREKILHIANGTEPQDLDPHVVTGGPEANIIGSLLEGLVGRTLPNLEPRPAVAESWDISEDGKTYLFHLRKDARWSNGDPVTANDFVWSWKRALHPKMANQYAYMLFAVINAQAFNEGKITDFRKVGVKAINPQTLEVKLNNPTPYFLQLLGHQSTFPLHRDTIEAHGKPTDRGTKWTRPGNYVGNGPFTLADWSLYKRVRVEKNPHYWDAENVRLNGIEFYPTENVSTEERMFRAGQLHATYTLSIDKIAVYQRENPEVLQLNPYLGTYYYRINVTEPHLQDKRVRRALNLAIDRKAIVEQVTKAGEKPTYTFTPPDTMGYTADSDLRFDPKEARKLLADAGYPDGKGFPSTTLLFNTQEGHQKIAVAIQQMWNQHLNISISLQNQEWKVFLNTIQQLDYDIGRAGWIGDYVDPNTFLNMWVTDGGNNQTGWSNSRYDKIINKLAPAAGTREERYALLREAESILLDELPVIPIYVYVNKRLVQPYVHGIVGNQLDHFNYKDIWIEPPENDR